MRHGNPLAVLAALAALAAAGPVAAQEAAKFGLVNTQAILEKSIEGRRALTQLQDSEKKYQAAVARLDDEAKQLQNRLNAQRLTLTPEAAAQIQAELVNKQMDRRRTAEDATQAMRDLQYTLLTKIQDEVVAVIEEVRKEKGLDVVFEEIKGGAVFYLRSLDLTAEVIRRYDGSKAVPPAKK